jgi:hypothetical protein
LTAYLPERDYLGATIVAVKLYTNEPTATFAATTARIAGLIPTLGMRFKKTKGPLIEETTQLHTK